MDKVSYRCKGYFYHLNAALAVSDCQDEFIRLASRITGICMTHELISTVKSGKQSCLPTPPKICPFVIGQRMLPHHSKSNLSQSMCRLQNGRLASQQFQVYNACSPTAAVKETPTSLIVINAREQLVQAVLLSGDIK